jgi:hypothetical protein
MEESSLNGLPRMPGQAIIQLATYAIPEGRHRSLGTHISRVFSLTLDKWEFADYESWHILARFDSLSQFVMF